MIFSHVAKRLLNAWNFLVLVLGCAVLITTVYIITCQSDTHAVPNLGYIASIVCGALLVLLAGLGLYGLRQHRHCISTGQRNFALGSYVLLGFAAGAVLVLAGAVALTFNTIIAKSKQNDFSDNRVEFLEEAMIQNLYDYSVADPNGWKNMQNSWFCCGYYNTTTIDDFLDLEYTADAQALNALPGIYCKTTNCTSGLPACPNANQVWCREVFLKNASTNNVYIGWISLAAGVAQLFGFICSVYILMCDIRMLERKSTNLLPTDKA
ncbi:transmembrane protein [Thraustotheca clavata]|uniref:Transmembrane protein n=1 Tax=Thraustotheca clavata TaxID=74557 RepID=A0A1V9ZSF7_9STRA|nr:transmembrane protein [Thraustotheca clavata]